MHASYVIRRLLQIIPTFLAVMLVVFLLVRLLPGDPASAILGDRATAEIVERTNRELGLDRPLPVQFGVFVRNLLRGDLGDSISLKIPVLRLIGERLPTTLFLTAYAAVLGVLADRTSIEYVYQIIAYLPLLGLVAALLPKMRHARR